MTTIVNLSGNQDIDGILWGWEWGTGGAQNLTFSFPTATAEYTDNGYAQINGFSSFNATQQTAVRTALADVASFCNLTFTETTATGATLRYADASSIDYTDDNTVATHTGLHHDWYRRGQPARVGIRRHRAVFGPLCARRRLVQSLRTTTTRCSAVSRIRPASCTRLGITSA